MSVRENVVAPSLDSVHARRASPTARREYASRPEGYRRARGQDPDPRDLRHLAVGRQPAEGAARAGPARRPQGAPRRGPHPGCRRRRSRRDLRVPSRDGQLGVGGRRLVDRRRRARGSLRPGARVLSRAGSGAFWTATKSPSARSRAPPSCRRGTRRDRLRRPCQDARRAFSFGGEAQAANPCRADRAPWHRDHLQSRAPS